MGCRGSDDVPPMMRMRLCDASDAITDIMRVSMSHEQAWVRYKVVHEFIFGGLAGFCFTNKDNLCHYSRSVALQHLCGQEQRRIFERPITIRPKRPHIIGVPDR